jgi:hypothetical protein
VESYAVPFALLGKIFGVSLNDVAQDMNEYLQKVHQIDSEVVSIPEDEDALLKEIAFAKIKIHEDYGERRIVYKELSVNQIIASEDNVDILEANGIRVIDEEGIVFLYLPAVAKLLKGTQFEGLNLRQILLRIPGAKPQKRRICGRAHHGIGIPLARFIEPYAHTMKD